MLARGRLNPADAPLAASHSVGGCDGRKTIKPPLMAALTVYTDHSREESVQ
jgi:hypothetical protein